MVHFILLCETFLKDANALFYQKPRYTFIHKSRKRLTKGGEAMYIINNVPYNIRDDLSPFYEGDFESVLAEVKMVTVK